MAMIERVAVVGAGTMGRQISLQIARNALPVVLYDAAESALQAAQTAHREIVAEWIASGTIQVAVESRLYDSMRYVTDLALPWTVSIW